MIANNIILLYLVEKNVLVSIKAIKFLNRLDCNTIDDFKKSFGINAEKMKYFDDEGEFISVINQEDFLTFKDLTFNKAFPNDKIRLIAYTGSLDLLKYGNLENLMELRVEKDTSSVPVDSKSFSSANNSSSCYEPSCFSSTTSSSSSIDNKKEPIKRKKSKNTSGRYAATMKKELNYLPGSEVSDGQTIVKKWRVKNVGTKKWKENTVKGVLLPSQFSDWVSCSTIQVPNCFADQNVDIEVQVSINGKWSDTDSSLDECSKQINLTWLLFKDCLVKKHSDNFKDHILTALDLSIIVIKRSLDTENYTRDITNDIEDSRSNSSIELVDEEFVSEDYNERRKADNVAKESTNSNANVLKLNSLAFDLDLPECPQTDDSPTFDFFLPSFIPVVQPDSYVAVDNVVAVSDSNRSLSEERDSTVQKVNDDTSSNRGSKPRISTDHEQSFISTNTEETDLSFVLTNDDDKSNTDNNKETGKLSWTSNISNESSILSPDTSLKEQYILTGDDSIVVSDNNSRESVIDDSTKNSSVKEYNGNQVSTNGERGEEVTMQRKIKDISMTEIDEELLALLNEMEQHVVTTIDEINRDSTTEISVSNRSLSLHHEEDIKVGDQVEEDVIVQRDRRGSDKVTGPINEIVKGDVINVNEPRRPSINIGFKDDVVCPTAPSMNIICNDPQIRHPVYPPNAIIMTPYQAGAPYPAPYQPINYAPGVATGWNYQAGIHHPHQQPAISPYPPNTGGYYQAGAPYPFQAMQPNFNAANSAPGARYPYPQMMPNATIRPGTPSAPPTDMRRHSAGHRM